MERAEWLRGREAFSHPAVRRYWSWLLGAYRPAAATALITPCSRVKPYTRSPASRKMRALLARLGAWGDGGPVGVEWLYFSDLLLLVPYRMAEEYPACCYDVPPELVARSPRLRSTVVTLLAEALRRLRRMGVRDMVVFLPKKHLEMWMEAYSLADEKPSQRLVGYTIYSFRGVAEALTPLIGEGRRGANG